MHPLLQVQTSQPVENRKLNSFDERKRFEVSESETRPIAVRSARDIGLFLPELPERDEEAFIPPLVYEIQPIVFLPQPLESGAWNPPVAASSLNSIRLTSAKNEMLPLPFQVVQSGNSVSASHESPVNLPTNLPTNQAETLPATLQTSAQETTQDPVQDTAQVIGQMIAKGKMPDTATTLPKDPLARTTADRPTEKPAGITTLVEVPAPERGISTDDQFENSNLFHAEKGGSSDGLEAVSMRLSASDVYPQPLNHNTKTQHFPILQEDDFVALSPPPSELSISEEASDSTLQQFLPTPKQTGMTSQGVKSYPPKTNQSVGSVPAELITFDGFEYFFDFIPTSKLNMHWGTIGASTQFHSELLPQLTVTPQFHWHYLNQYVKLRAPGTSRILVGQPENVYDFSGEFRLEVPLMNGFSVAGTIAPGFYSDMDNTSGDSFRLPASGILYFEPMPHLKFGLGVLDLDRDDVPFTFTGGVTYLDPKSTFRVELFYPKLKIAFRIPSDLHSEKWFYGYQEYLRGGTWAYQNVFDDHDALSYREQRIALGIEQFSRNGTSVFLEGGYAYDRRYQTRQFGGGRLSSTAALRMGYRY